MKRIIWFIIAIIGWHSAVLAQNTNANVTLPGSYSSTPISGYILNKTDTVHRRIVLSYASGVNDAIVRWAELGPYVAAHAPSPTITGGTILALPTIGETITTGSPDNVWNQMYRPPLPPTAGLSGGSQSEYSTSNKTHSLSWSYGRQATTATISTAVINPGSFNVFGSQPTQPGTVSGSQSVTTTANTNTTYTTTVTASSAPTTATASTADTWAPGIYYGRSTSTTPTSTEILAVAGGAKVISTGHAFPSGITVVASGSNHPFIAINATQGSITVIKDVNNFDVTSSFPTTTVSVTNVNGYTANYTVYTFVTATSSNYFFTTN